MVNIITGITIRIFTDYYYICGIDTYLISTSHFSVRGCTDSNDTGYILLDDAIHDKSVNCNIPEQDLNAIYNAFENYDKETLTFYALRYAI